MPPKTIVIGATGFIGRSFLQYYRSFFPDTIGTSRTPGIGWVPFDLESTSIHHLDLSGYTYAMIAAAWTKPVACALDPTRSHQCNVSHTLQIAHDLLQKGITPILFSSDYVFDGAKGHYSETSPHSPLNAYGAQKAELEQRLLNELPHQCLLLRLSKVYGVDPGDRTLLSELYTTLSTSCPIKAATDQIFSPLYIGDLICIVSTLQQEGYRGLWNVAGPEALSRYALAIRMASALNIPKKQVMKISINDLCVNVLRPKNTSLDIQMLTRTIHPNLQTIHQSIQIFLEELKCRKI